MSAEFSIQSPERHCNRIQLVESQRSRAPELPVGRVLATAVKNLRLWQLRSKQRFFGLDLGPHEFMEAAGADLCKRRKSAIPSRHPHPQQDLHDLSTQPKCGRKNFGRSHEVSRHYYRLEPLPHDRSDTEMPLRPQLLHIENDALVARAISRVLRLKGYKVRSIKSCQEARGVQPMDQVGIFDIDLGDGNGVALAEDLCRSGVVTHAVFFTACTDAESYRRARKSGPVINKTQGVSALLRLLSSELPSGRSAPAGSLKRTQSFRPDCADVG